MESIGALHLDHYQKQMPYCLDKEEQLYFECINTISKKENIQSNELGIRNVQSRLTILYGENYQLEYGEAHGKYKVVLWVL